MTKEKRAADQDAAIEQAFVDGTLPEEDRRHTEKPNLPDVALEPLGEPSVVGGAVIQEARPVALPTDVTEAVVVVPHPASQTYREALSGFVSPTESSLPDTGHLTEGPRKPV